MSDLEARHGMASAEFYRRFSAGELGDSLDWFEWAGLYELKANLLLRMQQLEAAPWETRAGSWRTRTKCTTGQRTMCWHTSPSRLKEPWRWWRGAHKGVTVTATP